MATLTEDRPNARAHVRKAEDFLESLTPGGNQLHRAVHSSLVNYRLQEITGDKARGVGSMPNFLAEKPGFRSPWHYHDCDCQLTIVLDGSAELAFVDGQFSRAGKGDIGFIPGHTAHDVTEPSADYRAAELTFPGGFGTIETPPPPAGSSSTAAIWGVGSAVRQGEHRGLVRYAHTLPEAQAHLIAVERERRTRLQPFTPGSLQHDNVYRFLLVTQGWREVEVEGERAKLEVADLLAIPQGAACEDLAASDDMEAVWVTMLR